MSPETAREGEIQSLIREIMALARKFADNDLGDIDADTPLISRFIDGEDAEEFAVALENRYRLAKPRMADMNDYRRELSSVSGDGLLGRWLSLSLRTPVVHLRDWTPRQLAEIAMAGAWPDACAFPEQSEPQAQDVERG